MWKVEQIRHYLIREVIITVRQEERLCSALPQTGEERRQPLILLHVLLQIFHRPLLQVALQMHPIDSVPHILFQNIPINLQAHSLHDHDRPGIWTCRTWTTRRTSHRPRFSCSEGSSWKSQLNKLTCKFLAGWKAYSRRTLCTRPAGEICSGTARTLANWNGNRILRCRSGLRCQLTVSKIQIRGRTLKYYRKHLPWASYRSVYRTTVL